MAAPETADEIRDVNTRYHDGAAAAYDAKWGIDFGEIGRRQVLQKVRKALKADLGVFDRSLEIGAGTGYFTLNMMQAGVIRSAVCTDISAGMLDTLAGNAARLELDVETKVADAEALPFPDASFDLVMGHAVLHHLPDLHQAFREFHRVLRPGGKLMFAGEPSRIGDRIAAYPKRGATRVAPLWRTLLRARPAAEGWSDGGAENHQLEGSVDVHAFVPSDLSAFARGAGFRDVDVIGEELLANWFGWTNRALEASADQADVPNWWRQYAYHGYLALQAVDRRVLESRLPPAIFYNLMIAATKA
ncbi:class I SAM-dependent methyltransferase [Paraconexibacter antarcticus]|uniref:Class I SAM-dependent methyltransferase n=1 Tax=Paraconexibacter antarcticus TaxID=2949664 RepID=A0ABY5E0X5_9ACTN|nr:class I SAM-dependent methyltransferase [Paraconexibacter antarcticus]UTI66480.1 class I SAM-dependent methyltransferase [Paraconexibacter antarcticus]